MCFAGVHVGSRRVGTEPTWARRDARQEGGSAALRPESKCLIFIYFSSTIILLELDDFLNNSK